MNYIYIYIYLYLYTFKRIKKTTGKAIYECL